MEALWDSFHAETIRLNLCNFQSVERNESEQGQITKIAKEGIIWIFFTGHLKNKSPSAKEKKIDIKWKKH